MAWRYKQEWFEDGDVLRPRDWLDNVGEIANELNGYLDSDNFRELSLDMNNVKSSAFNSFLTHQTGNTWAYDYENHGWISQESDGTELSQVTGEVSTDALYIIHFGCYWKWGGGEYDSRIYNGYHHKQTCVRFRLVANNTVVAETGWSPNTRNTDSTQMTAAIPLPAGFVNIRVEAQAAVANAMAPFTDFYSIGHKVHEEDDQEYDRPLKVYDRDLIVNIRKR